MTKDEIELIVIDELNKAQMDAGEDEIIITKTTVPIKDLTEFDSLTSVCVTCQLLDRFGLDNKIKVPSLFIESNNKSGDFRALSVEQVANKIYYLNAKYSRKVK